MEAKRAADYAAEVKRTVESAIHDAGFPGYYEPGALTVEHLARIAAVLETNPCRWFPDAARWGISDATSSAPTPMRRASLSEDLGTVLSIYARVPGAPLAFAL